MLGNICGIGWKDKDHHFIRIPGFQSLFLFVLVQLRSTLGLLWELRLPS